MKKKETKLLDAGELSRILAVSEFTVKKPARMRELPCVYVNRRPFFRLRDLLRYFRKLEGGAA